MTKKISTDAQQMIIMTADLESYHRFVSQPDVQQHIWTYLDTVFDCISTTFLGGNAFWDRPPKQYTCISYPQTTTDVGDGCVYVFTKDNLSETDIIELCDRLVILGQRFYKVRQYCQDLISPGIWIPERIRFGMSAGTAFIRRPDPDRVEHMEKREIVWAGYSGCLASRLCNYIKGHGPSAVFNARLPVRASTIRKHKYKCAMAKIREGVKEKVFVDEAEYEAMDPEIRRKLFEEI